MLPRDEHPVSRKLISENALKVISRLNKHGHEAYLVGGGVRDILLGGTPKDFDIATNAHPEEVHALFRNSRLIGRRFKLVHILFGREIIEVATFRGKAEAPQAHQHKQSDHGMLLRDNVYGTVEDDAIRRDFTVNALYYSPRDFCVYDFVDAMQDINSKCLRLIGDPETRYREDPVRMLRALRFQAKLGFDIEEDTKQAIYDFAGLIDHVSPARLFDEVIKLFSSGQGAQLFESLWEFGLFQALFPSISHTLNTAERQDYYRALIIAGLSNTDERVRSDKPITPAFLYAVLLWPDVERVWKQRIAEGESEFPAIQFAAQRAIQHQVSSITIPKRFQLMMIEIWEYQIRLKKTRGRAPFQLVEQKRFRAAYDFLILRERAGEQLDGLGNWWTQFQEKNPPAKVHDRHPGKERKKRPPRKRAGRRPANNS